MMGRTHGVHAEPLTLGLKLAVWYAEMQRNQARLIASLDNLQVGKISGAVGNYAHISPEVEKIVCERLGLKAACASSQILQRDRHADFMTTLAIISGSLEKMATEIRALQKTEFNEIQEPFGKGQKGSSAMPHKKNPIICERVTGLARVIRGYALTALENQALWHERDISHSSTERVIFPDATILLDYMFYKFTDVIANMQVNQDNMIKNMGCSYNVYYSQQLLLKLIEKGMLRETAYRLVQKNALHSFENKINFDENIGKDAEINQVLSKTELAEIFDFSKYTKNIDYIFDRTFK
jgi:adenylosuccinate lyase